MLTAKSITRPPILQALTFSIFTKDCPDVFSISRQTLEPWYGQSFLRDGIHRLKAGSSKTNKVFYCELTRCHSLLLPSEKQPPHSLDVANIKSQCGALISFTVNIGRDGPGRYPKNCSVFALGLVIQGNWKSQRAFKVILNESKN